MTRLFIAFLTLLVLSPALFAQQTPWVKDLPVGVFQRRADFATSEYFYGRINGYYPTGTVPLAKFNFSIERTSDGSLHIYAGRIKIAHNPDPGTSCFYRSITDKVDSVWQNIKVKFCLLSGAQIQLKSYETITWWANGDYRIANGQVRSNAPDILTWQK
jgi:hypothetical protein